jgi:hypothetical protein
MNDDAAKIRRAFCARAATSIGMAAIFSRAGVDQAHAKAQVAGANLASDGILAIGSTTRRSLDERFAEALNIKDYGALMDGIFDDTPAFLACIRIAESKPGTIIYMPAGVVNIASCTAATLQVPTETTIRGAGTDRTIVKWDDTSNTTNLFCGPSHGRGRNIVLEEFTVVGGWATHLNAPGSKPQCFPIYIQNVDALSIRHVCSKYSRMMGIRAGLCTQVSIDSCRVEYSGRDGINIEASSFVSVRDNDIQWCGDDCIAIHSAVNDVSTVRRNILVTGNRIFNAPGIKILAARQTIIAGNQLDVISSQGIGIETLPPGTYEGQANTSSVVITGNVITNLIDRSIVDGFNRGVVGIAISGASARAGSAGAIPGNNDTRRRKMIDPYAFCLSNSNSTTVPTGESRGVIVAANIVERTLPPCDGTTEGFNKFSDYGFGEMFTSKGWWNGQLPTAGLQGMGVSVMDGAVRDISIHDNIFRGIKGGLYHGNTSRSDSVSFKNNQVVDFTVAGVWLKGAKVRLFVENNVFDGDPYNKCSGRLEDTSWPNAYSEWAANETLAHPTPGLAPWGILVSAGSGIQVIGNRFRNVWSVSNINTNQPEKGNTFNFNIAECWPIRVGYSIKNRGIGAVNKEGGYYVCSIDSNLGDGPSFDTGASLILQSQTMPTEAGQWVPGRFVQNSQPIPIGGKILIGWVRLTVGSNNILGTDWVAVYGTTS